MFNLDQTDLENMRVSDLIDQVAELTEAVVQNDMEAVDDLRSVGLDPRSSYGPIYINDDYIAVRFNSVRVMEYYGGFEYVERDCVQRLGDYVFYSAENSRVEGHIVRWRLRGKSEEEIEEQLAQFDQ